MPVVVRESARESPVFEVALLVDQRLEPEVDDQGELDECLANWMTPLTLWPEKLTLHLPES